MSDQIFDGDVVQFSEYSGTPVRLATYGAHVTVSEYSGKVVKYSYSGQPISISSSDMERLPYFVKRHIQDWGIHDPDPGGL